LRGGYVSLDEVVATGIRVVLGPDRNLQEGGHINADGLSTAPDDRVEARAIDACLPHVPVAATRSCSPNLGAASRATEMAAGVRSFAGEVVRARVDCRRRDGKCSVCAAHNRGAPMPIRMALVVDETWNGQAVVLGGPDSTAGAMLVWAGLIW